MALISYQITSMVQDGSNTVVNLRYYVGAITTEDELFLSDTNDSPKSQNGVTRAVTRYRRTSVVDTATITKSGTHSQNAMVSDLNTALATKATELGHTPIDEQTNG